MLEVEMYMNKKALSLLLVFSMMFGISTSSFASEEENNIQNADSEIITQEITDAPPEIGNNLSMDELESLAQSMQDNITDEDGSFESPDMNTITEIEEQDNGAIEVNTKARDTWRITDSIFNGDGQLSASDPLDMYILSTTTDTTPVLKVQSGDSNVLAQLFVLDTATGNASPTNFIDQAGDSAAAIAVSLPAGDYILAVGSANNSSTAAYTLMWNCSNPANPTRVIYSSPNLDLVTLGYGYQQIKSNGTNLVASSNLKWEEEYTLTVGNSFWHRSQDISEVRINKLHLGKFFTNKYSTNNALFIEVGEGTLWSILRSSYENVDGDVTHIMDWEDATGRKTPRRFDQIDMEFGPHYIVVDLEQNLIVDFASPYNYLWQSGEIKGSKTFTAKDI